MIGVTGATGLLGSSIIRTLLAADEQVIAIKRKNSDTTLLNDIRHKITWRDADMLDPTAIDDALQGVSSIIHAAGLVSFNARDKRKLYETNVTGTRNLVNASMAHNIRRFVHVSSVAALSRPKEIFCLDENQKWTESPLNTVYAESKYLAELEVMRAHEEGLCVSIVNPSVILGPGDWTKSSSKIFEYVWKGNSFFTDGSLNYVDVNDVATIIHKLLYAATDGERYIVNAGNITYQLLFEKIAEHFQKKAPAIKVSKNRLALLAKIESLRSFLTGSSPLITHETARLARTTVTYSNQKIKNKLNFEFQSIDHTLKWCCEYYMKEANGKK
jgi:nucleoside-diphosphate-sugar epimerase